MNTSHLNLISSFFVVLRLLSFSLFLSRTILIFSFRYFFHRLERSLRLLFVLLRRADVVTVDRCVARLKLIVLINFIIVSTPGPIELMQPNIARKAKQNAMENHVRLNETKTNVFNHLGGWEVGILHTSMLIYMKIVT